MKVAPPGGHIFTQAQRGQSLVKLVIYIYFCISRCITNHKTITGIFILSQITSMWSSRSRRPSCWCPCRSWRAGRRASCPRRCCSSGGGSQPWWRSAATSSWCRPWRGRWTCGRPTSRRSQRASCQSGSWEIPDCWAFLLVYMYHSHGRHEEEHVE